MEKEKVAEKHCYLIDKKFCELTQKRIADVMGKVAGNQDSSEATTEILNDLADIRGFFQRKELREYSNILKDSIDMERFINPAMPVSKV